MSLLLKFNSVLKTLVELQLKLHCRTLVNLVIRLLAIATVIGLCWARIRGHGSSSVILLLERSMDDNDDRLADSSKTRGSIVVMKLLINDSVFS